LNLDPVQAQASYNAYAYLLTKSKAFLYGMEAVMGAFFIAHMYLAITLKIQNKKARGPVGYDVNARKGKKSFATFTMVFSGLFILVFLISHLVSLKFGTHYYYQSPAVADGKIVRDMWLTTVEAFANPAFSAFYVVGMFILGMHLWHAISSAFQTMGINHQKWTPFIEKAGMVYCLIVAGGFALTAAVSFYLANTEATQALILKSLELSKQLQAGGIQ
jgi:succinate dehydrogenase / fumarate reductase, cytochrome b subunit